MQIDGYRYNPHLAGGEKATSVLSLIFATAALIAAIALLVFSMGIIAVPTLTVTVTLLSTGGATLMALFFGIVSRALNDKLQSYPIYKHGNIPF